MAKSFTSKFVDIIHEHATIPFLLFFFISAQAIYVLMRVLTFGQMEEYTDLSPLDLRPFGYSPDSARMLFDELGEEGRSIYLTQQLPLDIVYPILLGTTFLMAISIVIKWMDLSDPYNKIIYVSVLTIVFDYAENLMILIMLLSYPDFGNGIVVLSSIFTLAKGFFTILAYVIIGSGVVVTIYDTYFSRKSEEQEKTEPSD